MNNLFVTTSKKVASKIVLFVSAMLMSYVTFGKDEKKVDVNITTKGDGGFLNNPIVWVIGIAVFILLQVAILKSSNKNALTG